MIRARNSEAAQRLYQQLAGESEPVPCVAAVLDAQKHLKANGFQGPDWQLLWNGARPEQVTEGEPGEWKHGWQYFAATRLETHTPSTRRAPPDRKDVEEEC